MAEMKNELGHVYGTYEVTAYTDRRESGNGCVIWECICICCGTKYHISGNRLRFHKIGPCPICKPKKNR